MKNASIQFGNDNQCCWPIVFQANLHLWIERTNSRALKKCCNEKVEQKRVQLLLDDWMALDGQTKCDLEVVIIS